MGYLKNAKFISCADEKSAVMFRKKFKLPDFKKASLYVCGLGVGYFWLNGEKVSTDLFTASVSDYRKTVWVNKYDVSALLFSGENIFSAFVGNGFYNETTGDVWNFSTAPWKDCKKLFVRLIVDGKTVFESDQTFKCTSDTPVSFNELRIGEYFDFNKYNPFWNTLNFDDSGWQSAFVSNPPKGKLRLINCPAVKEGKTIRPRKIYRFGDRTVFDFGYSLSGYACVSYCGKKGEQLILKFAEDFDGKDLIWHNMGRFYGKDYAVQTDKIICSGKPFTYTPYFTYHGFRYLEISGHTEDITASAVFAHQAIKRATTFNADDKFLNKLYGATVISTLSNAFNVMTDCPSREKLGWYNDATCSLEQILTNFDSRSFLKKWFVDIIDSQKPDGSISAVAPNADWGYGIYDTLTCGMMLIDLPLKLVELYGDYSLLNKYKKNIRIYFDHAYQKVLSTDKQFFFLGDWNGTDNGVANGKFVELCLLLDFIKKYDRAINLNPTVYDKTLLTQRECVVLKLLNGYFTDGLCNDKTFTSLSMALYLGLGDVTKNLTALDNLLNEVRFAPKYGIVGLLYFTKASMEHGTGRLISLLKARGGIFRKMMRKGKTLFENVNFNVHCVSLNHHMYSCFCTALIKNVLGLIPQNGKVIFRPDKTVPDMTVKGSYGCGKNKVKVSVIRQNEVITTQISVPKDDYVIYNNKHLKKGIHNLVL